MEGRFKHQTPPNFVVAVVVVVIVVVVMIVVVVVMAVMMADSFGSVRGSDTRPLACLTIHLRSVMIHRMSS